MDTAVTTDTDLYLETDNSNLTTTRSLMNKNVLLEDLITKNGVLKVLCHMEELKRENECRNKKRSTLQRSARGLAGGMKQE